MNGVICGGLISQSMHEENVKKFGVWADTMCYIMPDDKYAEYRKLQDTQEKVRFFKKYAVSQI